MRWVYDNTVLGTREMFGEVHGNVDGAVADIDIVWEIIKKPVKAAESNLQAFGRIRWHIQQFLYRLRKHIGRKPEVILSNVFEGIGEVGASDIYCSEDENPDSDSDSNSDEDEDKDKDKDKVDEILQDLKSLETSLYAFRILGPDIAHLRQVRATTKRLMKRLDLFQGQHWRAVEVSIEVRRSCDEGEHKQGSGV
ncbi:uncharacterized protein TRAVEDRAFT_51394 [Trametes versicolor FP-101664 SS1]|uniref:uncharacterized protein n=1 Tax=Trametes versicolor (strain FP-101664) TaxID=717944 RepID=UPI0004623A24|nr:uncharacterized protein TRAVEDRAFT_51394 [Trametes versicolor FP-101664 SS1]EIW55270.1 hypothetical protein TRAVEDRAFT_51394 [Trametes versicolor FP-101664 SS1]